MESADLHRLIDDLREIKSDIATIRSEIRNSMIEVAVIKAKLGFIAGGAAIIASILVQVASKIFF